MIDTVLTSLSEKYQCKRPMLDVIIETVHVKKEKKISLN